MGGGGRRTEAKMMKRVDQKVIFGLVPQTEYNSPVGLWSSSNKRTAAVTGLCSYHVCFCL